MNGFTLISGLYLVSLVFQYRLRNSSDLMPLLWSLTIALVLEPIVHIWLICKRNLVGFDQAPERMQSQMLSDNWTYLLTDGFAFLSFGVMAALIATLANGIIGTFIRNRSDDTP